MLIAERREHQFLARMLCSVCIGSWRSRSVHASVPYAYVLLIAQHGLKKPFQIWNFYAYPEPICKKLMCMVRVCISSWGVCSANTSVPDMYAQGTKQYLTRMLSMFWRDCAQCTNQFLTSMLSARIISWHVCSTYASVPDANAQGQNSSWRACSVGGFNFILFLEFQ
jgi:hypothetical protein